ncbi:MAG TPA: hypothetical protein VF350_04655 [Candidatus Bathyarchaeia archaeon]
MKSLTKKIIVIGNLRLTRLMLTYLKNPKKEKEGKLKKLDKSPTTSPTMPKVDHLDT